MTEDWRQGAQQFLGDLLAFREAVTQIEGRYVDGIPLMLPDVARNLGQVTEGMEVPMGIFNDLMAGHGQAEPVDLEAVRKNASKKAAGQMKYLVDMAKAEALD